MFKIITISLIVTLIFILSFSLCLAKDADSLEQFVSHLCGILEKSEFAEFTKLIRQDAQLDGQPTDSIALEKIFSELKEAHRQYNYQEIYKSERKSQGKFIREGKFYLGGHKYGHLALKVEKQGDSWLIASFDHCK